MLDILVDAFQAGVEAESIGKNSLKLNYNFFLSPVSVQLFIVFADFVKMEAIAQQVSFDTMTKSESVLLGDQERLLASTSLDKSSSFEEMMLRICI